MKNLLRSWAVRGLLIGSLITAPWAAIAAFNQAQNDNGTTGFLSTIASSGIQALTFFNNGQVVRTASTNGAGAHAWAFDEKEYNLYITDLGTASSAIFVVPETGVIQEVTVTWGATFTGSAAVMAMYRFTAASLVTNTNFAAQAATTKVSAFSITALTTQVNGGKQSDDIIFQAVNRGDVIAIDTDGGPSNAVPGFITIRIRAAGIQ